MSNWVRLFSFASLLLIASSARADQAEYFVGVIVPLTGPLATYGEAMQNGITLAQEELPKGIQKCPLMFEDSQYDPKQALSAYRKLDGLGKMSYVFAFGGPITEALAPETEKAGKLFFTSESESKFAENRKYVVRVADPSEDHVRPLLAEFDKRGHHDLTFLRTDNQYLEGIYRAIKKVAGSKYQIHELGLVQPADKEFRTQLLKLKQRPNTTLGVFMLPGQIQSVYRTLRELKIQVPTFSVDFLDSTEERLASLPAISGALYCAHNVTDDFRKRYTARFKNDSQISWAGFAYEFQRVVNKVGCSGSADELLQKVKGYSSPELLVKVKGTPSTASVIGAFEYKESPAGDKYFSVPSYVKEVSGDGAASVLDRR